MENSEDKELSINFVALWKLIKQSKWMLIVPAFIFAMLTAIIVFQKPNEYTSLASLMPELESSSTGGTLSKFAGLASLAGVDLSNISTSDAVRPDLYPSVINNSSFYLYLLEQPVRTSDGKLLKFRDFYNQIYDIESDSLVNNKIDIIKTLRDLLGVAIKPVSATLKKNEQIIFLSKADGEIIEELLKKISADMDKKTGIISISVKLPDPLTAAHVAQISINYLTTFVANYRTEKARQDRDFIAQRLSEAKGKFYNVQSKKASYSDQFQASTIRFQSADVARERIESDYRVSSTFYTELLQQYETAKMKVQEQTPVFKTLQQPIVPYEKSGPRRLILLIFAAIVGFGFGLGLLLLKNNNYKSIIA